KSPGYGQLKLPHLMIVVTALHIGSRSGRTFIFGPFSQQGDRGVERLEATPAKHGIYATRSQRHPARDPQTDGGRSQDDPALPGAAGWCAGKFPRGSDHRAGERGRPNSSTPTTGFWGIGS